MNIFAISSLVNFISVVVVGAFVYMKNKAGDANRKFLLFVFAMAFWSGNYFIWQLAKDASTALLFSRLLMIGAIFISITLFHFVLAVLGLIEQKKKWLIFGYSFAAVLLLFSFSPYFVKDVAPKLMFPFWPEPGFLFHIYLIFDMTLFFLYSCILLYKGYRQASGIRRTQLFFLFICALITIVNGWTNNLLWYNIPVAPYGNFGVPVLMIGIAYIMVKYSFLVPTPALAAETIVKAIPDLLIVFDRDFKIAFTNVPTLSILGYEKGDIYGKPFESVVSVPNLAELKEKMLASPITEYELDFVTKNNQKIPVHLNSYPLKQSMSNVVIGVVTVGHDMRQINDYIQGLKETKEALEKSNNELNDKYKEVERVNKLMVDRELRIIELKEQIKKMGGQA